MAARCRSHRMSSCISTVSYLYETNVSRLWGGRRQLRLLQHSNLPALLSPLYVAAAIHAIFSLLSDLNPPRTVTSHRSPTTLSDCLTTAFSTALQAHLNARLNHRPGGTWLNAFAQLPQQCQSTRSNLFHLPLRFAPLRAPPPASLLSSPLRSVLSIPPSSSMYAHHSCPIPPG